MSTMTYQEINEIILQEYVNKVCHHSRIAADAVKIYLADIEETETSKQEFGAIAYAEILMDFITLFLHITDRFLFQEFAETGSTGLELRDELMDELVERCINSALDFCWFGFKEDVKQEYKKSSFMIHNARMKKYSKYKQLFAEKDEGLKDTLFWEFSKNICSLVENQHNIGLMQLCIKVAVDALAEIDPKSLANNIEKAF
ncbi:MAG: hypothetical protein JXD22_09855 [Sedimentisphaerales bacterium]|nr:hypothetical protein [Sedimentisphaerales bacterium]